MAARSLASAALALSIAGCGSSSPGGPGESAAPTLAPGIDHDFPIGTWTSELTEEDWAGSGIPNVEENTGRFVLTFEANGRWRSVQTSLAGVLLREPIFRGTYTATGDSVRLVTDFPERYAGFVDVLSWRLEGDALHLAATQASDQYAGVIYGAHPWYRP